MLFAVPCSWAVDDHREMPLTIRILIPHSTKFHEAKDGRRLLKSIRPIAENTDFAYDLLYLNEE
jgi:hypothetical protein